MGLIYHYSTFVSLSIEEQESLEGHSLYPFSLPVYDRHFLFDIRYQPVIGFLGTLLVFLFSFILK